MKQANALLSDLDVSRAAADWALSQVGAAYSQAKRRWEGIFDCSSLVARAYSAQGKRWKHGGSVPTSNYEVYDDDFELLWPATYAEIGKAFGGKSVISRATRAGDLQYLCTDSDTGRANRITHVAMVASAEQIVHARGTKYGVRTDSINLYSGRVCAVARYNPSCALRFGMKGYRTLALQAALNRAGADLAEDGDFGSETRSAVRAHQKSAGRAETGIADEATLTSLDLSQAEETDTSQASAHDAVRVTGNTVYIRSGPGTQFEWISVARKGDAFQSVDADGWFPILMGGDVCWISEKYSARVSASQ